MSDQTSANQNGKPSCRPEAYGQAAYLLVESLLHELIKQSSLTLPQVIEVVEVAHDVRLEVAHHQDDASDVMVQSVALLERLAASLRRDSRIDP